MSGSLESARWNACVHRLGLGIYSHPKEFLGNGVRVHVNSKGEKIPLPTAQRRIELATRQHAGQRAQHTTDYAIPPPSPAPHPLPPPPPPHLPPPLPALKGAAKRAAFGSDGTEKSVAVASIAGLRHIDVDVVIQGLLS